MLRIPPHFYGIGAKGGGGVRVQTSGGMAALGCEREGPSRRLGRMSGANQTDVCTRTARR